MVGTKGHGGQKGRSGGPRLKTRADDKRGRPATSYISKNGVAAVKIDPATRIRLELLSSRLGAEPSAMVARLIEERLKEVTMKTYTYTPLAIDDLTSTDLRQEAAEYRADAAQAATITIYRADGRPEAERAEALYLPDEGRLGIAWGADATWADVTDLESGIEMWLNDGDVWEAAN